MTRHEWYLMYVIVYCTYKLTRHICRELSLLRTVSKLLISLIIQPSLSVCTYSSCVKERCMALWLRACRGRRLYQLPEYNLKQPLFAFTLLNLIKYTYFTFLQLALIETTTTNVHVGRTPLAVEASTGVQRRVSECVRE